MDPAAVILSVGYDSHGMYWLFAPAGGAGAHIAALFTSVPRCEELTIDKGRVVGRRRGAIRFADLLRAHRIRIVDDERQLAVQPEAAQ